MGQDRMLRESLRTSEKVNSWPIPLRFFWTQLWGYCDDWGRGKYDARLIVADTFPIDDDVTAEVVGSWMEALEMAGVIRVYEVQGKRYFVCVHWDEHQEISYRKRTTVPDYLGNIPKAGKRSETFQNVLELSGPSKGKGREVEGEVEGEGTPTPFCSEHPNGTDSPCRGCGNARRLFDIAEADKRNRPTMTPPRGVADPETCQHKWTDNYCAVCLARREAVAS
jgi:hypothetical protein